MAKELIESLYPKYKKVLVKSPSRKNVLSHTYENPDEFPFRVYTVNHNERIEYVYGVFKAEAFAKAIIETINNGTEKTIDEIYDSNKKEQYNKLSRL